MPVQVYYSHEYDRKGRYEGPKGRKLKEQAMPMPTTTPATGSPATTPSSARPMPNEEGRRDQAEEAKEHKMGIVDDKDYGGEIATVPDADDYAKLSQKVKLLEQQIADLTGAKIEQKRDADIEEYKKAMAEAASPDYTPFEDANMTASGVVATSQNMPRTPDKQLAVRGQAKPSDKGGKEDQDDFEKDFLSATEDNMDEFPAYDTDQQGGEKNDASKSTKNKGKTITKQGQDIDPSKIVKAK